MTQGDEASWSASDRERIAAEGLTLGEMNRQLDLFRSGISPVRLNRPCRAGDGIISLSPGQEDDLIAVYDTAVRSKRLIKFVPASGAASRMFKGWYQALHDDGFATQTEWEAFARDLSRYPFFADLRRALSARGVVLEDLIRDRADGAILKCILTGDGLGYGRLPKALLPFHCYSDGCRTALEEHLVEAALYARDARNRSRVHFTVSSEHEQEIREYLTQTIPVCEAKYGTVLEVPLSTQQTFTNTLAVDPKLRPFRDEQGALVFRPGGHGALLQNLDAIAADIIFIKNIDNIVPDRLKPETVRWKKLLAAYLSTIQDDVFRRLRLLEGDGSGAADLEKIASFCRERLHGSLPEDFEKRSRASKRALLFDKLNRPIRVCGMVKNAGEPGGGPFWVDDARGDAGQSLQIVEEMQIDRNDPKQRVIWSSSTHFNPVDLVCGVNDFRGGKFALARFVDPAQSIISRKSEQGKELLALERPGLWNGSMALWNTLFIEVPLISFNPVKVITDLLRPEHCAT